MGTGEIPALQFAHIARALGTECRRLGLPGPAFRAPPRLPVDRTIRRHANATVVAVRIRGRDVHDWTSDMVDGCVAAARLEGEEATALRSQLWVAAGEAVAA